MKAKQLIEFVIPDDAKCLEYARLGRNKQFRLYLRLNPFAIGYCHVQSALIKKTTLIFLPYYLYPGL